MGRSHRQSGYLGLSKGEQGISCLGLMIIEGTVNLLKNARDAGFRPASCMDVMPRRWASRTATLKYLRRSFSVTSGCFRNSWALSRSTPAKISQKSTVHDNNLKIFTGWIPKLVPYDDATVNFLGKWHARFKSL